MSPSDLVTMMLDRHAELCAATGAGGISLHFSEIEGWMFEAKLDHANLLNQMSINVAVRFDRCEVSYQAADWLMNNLWFAFVATQLAIPTIFDNIYEAFDAGEYIHSEDKNCDPVEKYTRPAIKEILGRLE